MAPAPAPTPPGRGPRDCLCFSLRASSRLITQIYDARLRDLGIGAGQLAILRIVATLGPLAMTRLAGHFEAHQTTMSREVQPLIKRRLLKTRTGDDARQRLVEITPQGRKVVAAGDRLWAEVQDEVEAAIGKGRFARLLDDLEKIKLRLAHAR